MRSSQDGNRFLIYLRNLRMTESQNIIHVSICFSISTAHCTAYFLRTTDVDLGNMLLILLLSL